MLDPPLAEGLPDSAAPWYKDSNSQHPFYVSHRIQGRDHSLRTVSVFPWTANSIIRMNGSLAHSDLRWHAMISEYSDAFAVGSGQSRRLYVFFARTPRRQPIMVNLPKVSRYRIGAVLTTFTIVRVALVIPLMPSIWHGRCVPSVPLNL